MSRNWPRVRLGEVCQRVDYGFTASADFSIHQPKFLRITDIQNGKVDWKSVPGCKISEEEIQANQLADGDIVFARTGATTGKSYLIKNPPRSVFASYLIRLRLNEDCLPDYLILFLQGEEYWRQIRQGARGGIQPNFNSKMLANLLIALPSLEEQRRIAARLKAQLAAVAEARKGIAAQTETLRDLVSSEIREGLAKADTVSKSAAEAIDEVTEGVGASWEQYRVLGATRDGLALAKEPVGKRPERYKPVLPGTVFYNPMRIMIGSIAMLDDGEEPGITSPDYVVLRTREKELHPIWFYEWLRSGFGARFILSLARGAVRERMMFTRLKQGAIPLPPIAWQRKFSEMVRQVRQAIQALDQQSFTFPLLSNAILRETFADLS